MQRIRLDRTELHSMIVDEGTTTQISIGAMIVRKRLLFWMQNTSV